MSTAFLPHDYEAPRTTGSYMKIQDGDNKIRILSSPVLGWEEWVDNKPVRYRYENKPEQWKDPARPGKHFWAFIVWNYSEERVQILHITQASIRRDLEALVKDSDWGDPFFYDVKINRSGKDLKTKYTINPLPHKPLADHIQEAFESNPCNLESLFTGDDPFGDPNRRTHAFFEMIDSKISKEQVEEIDDLIGDDAAYREKVLSGIKKMFGVAKLEELPKEKYQAILKSVKLHAKERLEKEMANDGLNF